MSRRILILGGGFGGLTAAVQLHRATLPDTEITVLTDQPWVTYYGALYRLLRGKPLAQVCIPLGMILPKNVQVIIDRAVSVDPATRTVKGEKESYSYDTVILALGSEPAFFNIPGMSEHALRMMTLWDALGIRGKVLECVQEMKTASPERQRILGRFAVIGGGATGVEISGELLPYARGIAAQEGVDPSLIEVDLIEATDKLFPPGGPDTSRRVVERLRSIGVNVRLSHAVASVEAEHVHFKDGVVIEAGTIIWTAGVQASAVLASVAGLERDKRGRAIVDDHLRAKGVQNMYVLGDCASTPFAGMAQTAVDDGVFIARTIVAEARNERLPVYAPTVPAFALPAGGHWAAVKYGPIRTHGFFGYVLRRLADIHVYTLLLPWRNVWAAFRGTIPLEKYGVDVIKGKEVYIRKS